MTDKMANSSCSCDEEDATSENTMTTVREADVGTHEQNQPNIVVGLSLAHDFIKCRNDKVIISNDGEPKHTSHVANWSTTDHVPLATLLQRASHQKFDNTFDTDNDSDSLSESESFYDVPWDKLVAVRYINGTYEGMFQAKSRLSDEDQKAYKEHMTLKRNKAIAKKRKAIQATAELTNLAQAPRTANNDKPVQSIHPEAKQKSRVINWEETDHVPFTTLLQAARYKRKCSY